MKQKLMVLAFLSLITTQLWATDPAQLPPSALNNVVYTQNGDSLTLKEVLSQFENKTIMIDIWASWCKDCIAGFPKVKSLQAENTETVYLFLSVDKEHDAWNKGIERFSLEGNHFRIKGGWKSDFCNSVALDWIPRYLVVNSKGEILHYKSIEADDKKLSKAIRSNS